MTLRLLPSSGKTDFTRFNTSTTWDFGTVSGRSIRLLEYFNDFQQPTAYIISFLDPGLHEEPLIMDNVHHCRL